MKVSRALFPLLFSIMLISCGHFKPTDPLVKTVSVSLLFRGYAQLCIRSRYPGDPESRGLWSLFRGTTTCRSRLPTKVNEHFVT